MKKSIFTLVAAVLAAATVAAQTPTTLGVGIANPAGNLHVHSMVLDEPLYPPVPDSPGGRNGFTDNYTGIFHMTNGNTGTTTDDGFSIIQYDYDVVFRQHENGIFWWELPGNGKVWMLKNGRVGIGDTTVGYKLSVGGNANVTGNLNVVGNITAGSMSSLTVNGALSATGSASVANRLTVGNRIITDSLTVNHRTNMTGNLSVGDNAFIVTPLGYVYCQRLFVGGFSLSVNSTGDISTTGSLTVGNGFHCDAQGNLKVKQLRVTLTDWPDYVFGEGYRLMSLGEVEAYIGENGHLPQMPSAAEVEAEGADLGEMNRLLLQKVEELTLYVIDLQRQLDELKSNNSN